MNVWASIVLWENADPDTDRILRETASERLTIAFVPDVEAAARVAAELVDGGTELIELCGGFGLDAGAIVSKAVGGRAAVGAVMFGIESLTPAAAYKAKFEAGD